jgi:hypothetical protein
MSKYKKWYQLITSRGQTRQLDTYTEKHHILPESLGGLDTPENLTTLTAREHFICHWLLIKIYKDGEAHWKMLNAIRIMRAENKNQQRYDTKITSRVYSNLKEEYSRLQSERVRGENNPMYGKPVSESVRKGRSERAKGDNNPSKLPGVGDKISEAKKGVKRKKFSAEWKSKMSLAKQGENNSIFGKNHSHETIEKIREKAKLRTYSDETNEKRRLANLGKTKPKKLCIHCNKEVAVNGYARWHGDNCKEK